MVSEFEVARRTSVPAERLNGWVQRFTDRHGELAHLVEPDALVLHGADGAQARLLNLWEPLPAGTDLDAAVKHLLAPRVFAVLLVRKNANAVGVTDGDEILAHRVSRHYVQARTKAGGWSQQRYARRRASQARNAWLRAADDAFEVIVPHLGRLSALVTGGDRQALNEVLADPRLAGLAALPRRHPILPVPDARLHVLTDAVASARSIPIDLDALAISIPEQGARPTARPAPRHPDTGSGQTRLGMS